MPDFATQRRIMVDNQLRTTEVTDHDVLDAFGTVPRELFVPAHEQALAYTDRDIVIAPGRAAMRPQNLARMIQGAGIRPGDRVLAAAAGTGYGAAIAARLSASVVALEADAGLAETARAALAAAGASVAVTTGPLAAGLAAGAPYDVILVEGAVEDVPAALLAQLADGGRLVVVEGRGLSGQTRLHTRSGGSISARSLFNCAAPLLPGTERAPAFAF